MFFKYIRGIIISIFLISIFCGANYQGQSVITLNSTMTGYYYGEYSYTFYWQRLECKIYRDKLTGQVKEVCIKSDNPIYSRGNFIYADEHYLAYDNRVFPVLGSFKSNKYSKECLQAIVNSYLGDYNYNNVREDVNILEPQWINNAEYNYYSYKCFREFGPFLIVTGESDYED